jgi:probable F420-dependent oxidoreductase
VKLDTVLGGDLGTAGKVAKAAEALGFAGIWTAEAQQTPYLPLGVAAIETERIELGTSIAVAFSRSPYVHAMTAWDLQKASKGRFILGLGTQIKKHNERRFSVAFDRPVARLRDMVLAIRHIWGAFDGDHPLDYHGEFYTHDYVTPFFSGGPCRYGKPRIMIAAVGPLACRTAGEVCDGILVHPFHSIRYIEEVVRPNVESGRASRDERTAGDFEYATTAFVITGDEAQQEAMAGLARSQLAFYGSTPAYRKVFEVHGWGAVQPELQSLMRQGRIAEMAGLITDDMLDVYAVRAPFDKLGAALKAKYDGVCDRVGFYMPIVGGGQEDEWAQVIADAA